MDRAELQSVAAKAVYLRGLEEVPVGLTLLYVAALPLLSPLEPSSLQLLLLVPIFVAGVVARLMRRHYDRTLGAVARRQTDRRAMLAMLPLVPVYLFGMFLELRVHDIGIVVLEHCSVVALTFGLVLLVRYRLLKALCPHHLVLWGGLAVLGALPVWGWGTPADPSVIMSQALLVIAVAVTVNGTLNHQFLVRAFPPVGADDDA